MFRLASPLSLPGRRLLLVGACALALAPSLAQPSPPTGDKTVEIRAHPTRAWGGETPAGWNAADFDDRSWTAASGSASVSRAALVPDAGQAAAPVGAPLGATGALYLRRQFDVPDAARVRVLELRVTYSDGFVAYLNGAEVARRNLPAGAWGRPPVPHGPEGETIFLLITPGGVPLRPRGNVLAVRIGAAAGRTRYDPAAPAGALELAAFAGVRIVRGPYLIAPADGAVSVAWETDLPARGRVEVEPAGAAAGGGESAARSRRVEAPGPAARQVVRLDGLEAGRSYRYRVVVADPAAATGAGDEVVSASAEIRTAPRTEDPLRFAVYGDMRAPGHAAHAEVVAALVRERPALVLNTGDLVAIGSEESDWQRYFSIAAPLGAIAPVVPALGNHDTARGGTGAAKSWSLFGMKAAAGAAAVPGYTSFDWGGAHFVILDSNQPTEAQRRWVERDLAAARRRGTRAIFAFCHAGPWAHGVHGDSEVMARVLAPALAAGRVDVLFSGHDHLYERGVGTTPRGPLPYVVTGGGGAPLYNPSCRVAPAAEPLAVAGTSPPRTVAAARTLAETATASPTGKAAAAAPAALPAATASLPACPPSVAALEKTHHYIIVEVEGRTIRLCTRLPGGDPVEPCVTFPAR
jgi:hypothetical protein